MKSREVHSHVGNTPITVLPSLAAADDVSYQETSHVFKCMRGGGFLLIPLDLDKGEKMGVRYLWLFGDSS